MGMFDMLDVSASGMTAQRLRLDVISNNIANVNTTRSSEGGPYRRERVVFQEKREKKTFSDYLKNSKPAGVRVASIQKDDAPFKTVYDPTHPDADEEGFVDMPNVDMLKEMVDLIAAARAYEANVTAINAEKNMALKALEIGR